MTENTQDDVILPKFRSDLRLYKGPDDSDGSPTYNLYDPTRAQYFRLTWSEAVVLRNAKPRMTLNELYLKIKNHTTLEITQDDIKQFYNQAAYLNFLILPQPAERFIEEAKRQKTNFLIWLIFHYLYIRLPLLKPDRFLQNTLYFFKYLISPIAFAIYFIITFLGLVGLAGQWDEYVYTFTYFFNFQGFIIYALAVSCVRCIHEFSHAYMAKYYGIHVPTMGILLMVLWPGLYTDVTDSWKLKNRFQRFAISFAGVGAELILAGLATFAWTLTEPGLLRSIFFIISSVTWITSVFVNLNPAMRFDGYYLLCDLWAIDNLQPRAFAITRWKLRKFLWGLDIPPPERFSSKRITGLIIYSLYTWTYRLVLYTGIAVFVYYKFTKTLGIFLYLVEIIFFILWPIKWEFEEIMRLRKDFTLNKRLLTTTLVLLGLFLWVAIPWSHAKLFPAIVIPLEEQIIYVPFQAHVEKIEAFRGEEVKINQLLVQLDSRELKDSIKDLQTDINILKKQIYIDTLLETNDTFNPTLLPQNFNELLSKEDKWKGLKELEKLMTLKAKINGKIYSWDENLKIGQFVAKDQIIGKIAKDGEKKIVAYLPEEYLHYAKVGKKAFFRFKNSNDFHEVIIDKIEPSRTSTLPYPTLASTYKGDLPVVQTGVDPGKAKSYASAPQPVLIGTYYAVYLIFRHAPLDVQYENTGYVEIIGNPESILFNYIQFLKRIILRESNF